MCCDDLVSILTEWRKLRCDVRFICGEVTHAKDFKN